MRSPCLRSTVRTVSVVATALGALLSTSTARSQMGMLKVGHEQIRLDLEMLLFGYERIRPDRVDAKLICVSGTHAVWMTWKVIESTRQDVVQTYTCRFYRQALTEPDAVLIEFWRSAGQGGGGRGGRIMADGTVLFVGGGGLSGGYWLEGYRIDGKRFRIDVGRIPVAGLDADGILLHSEFSTPQARNGANPVEFVPFLTVGRGGGVELGPKVEVVPPGVKRFLSQEPVRSGDRFAWIHDGSLHVFDLRGRTTTKTRFKAPLAKDDYVSAYDGETVVAGLYAFDAKTGAVLGGQDLSKRPVCLAGVFAVRHRVGYYHKGGNLMAVDLTSPEGASVVLAPAKDVPSAETDAGLIVWDGAKWVTVPWVKEWKGGAETCKKG